METGEKPSSTEVVSQLDLILTSALFASAETQGKVLRLIVENALAGKPTKGIDLKIEIGGYHAEDSHLERQTASIARQKVLKYYKTIGKHDFVKIDLLPGPNYKVNFSYNLSAEAIRSYRLGLAYRRSFSKEALDQAMQLIESAKSLAPESATICLSFTETALLLTIWDHIFFVSSPRGPSTYRQIMRLTPGAHLAADSWRANIILGGALLLDLNLAQAGTYFSKALELNRERTDSSLWYAAYLMLTGKTDEGVEIARVFSHEHPGDHAGHVAFLFFLYAAGKFESISEVYFAIPTREKRSEVMALLSALVGLSREDDDYSPAIEALEHIPHEGRIPFNCGRQRFPGIYMMLLSRFPSSDLLSKEIEKLRGERRRCEEIFARHLPVPTEYDRRYEQFLAETTRRPLQWALAYMAIGREGRAMAMLRKAFRERDMITGWLHVLPLFQPFKAHPRFQPLVKTICEEKRSEGGFV